MPTLLPVVDAASDDVGVRAVSDSETEKSSVVVVVAGNWLVASELPVCLAVQLPVVVYLRQYACRTSSDFPASSLVQPVAAQRARLLCKVGVQTHPIIVLTLATPPPHSPYATSMQSQQLRSQSRNEPQGFGAPNTGEESKDNSARNRGACIVGGVFGLEIYFPQRLAS